MTRWVATHGPKGLTSYSRWKYDGHGNRTKERYPRPRYRLVPWTWASTMYVRTKDRHLRWWYEVREKLREKWYAFLSGKELVHLCPVMEGVGTINSAIDADMDDRIAALGWSSTARGDVVDSGASKSIAHASTFEGLQRRAVERSGVRALFVPGSYATGACRFAQADPASPGLEPEHSGTVIRCLLDPATGDLWLVPQAKLQVMDPDNPLLKGCRGFVGTREFCARENLGEGVQDVEFRMRDADKSAITVTDAAGSATIPLFDEGPSTLIAWQPIESVLNHEGRIRGAVEEGKAYLQHLLRSAGEEDDDRVAQLGATSTDGHLNSVQETGHGTQTDATFRVGSLYSGLGSEKAAMRMIGEKDWKWVFAAETNAACRRHLAAARRPARSRIVA